jgi:hypothetical protein
MSQIVRYARKASEPLFGTGFFPEQLPMQCQNRQNHTISPPNMQVILARDGGEKVLTRQTSISGLNFPAPKDAA